MTRDELRALILRWSLARGYQPPRQAEGRSYGGDFLAGQLGLRPWDVSNVVRGDWACVRQMRTPVKMAAALELDLREVWPREAGALPGLRDVPDPPHVVRPCTIGIGYDIPAPPEPVDKPDLHQLIARLPERQRFVLAMRFGLDGPEMSLELLGMMLGCTRERVRQIELDALQQLRWFLGERWKPDSKDARARVAPWREGRADTHRARSCPASQAVELERAIDRIEESRATAVPERAQRQAARASESSLRPESLRRLHADHGVVAELAGDADGPVGPSLIGSPQGEMTRPGSRQPRPGNSTRPR